MTFDYDALHKQELRAITQPVHPGIPGKQPFWNEHGKRFVYAPAFDFKKVEGAVRYRFSIQRKGKSHSFETQEPWAALTPIWGELPVGKAQLKVEGIAQDGTVVGLAGERSFVKQDCFKGPYKTSETTYSESARKGFEAVFELGHVQQWLKTGKPDPDQPLYGYPAKIMGATVNGLSLFAKDYATDKAEAEVAIKIARMNADLIIVLSDPPGGPKDVIQDFFPLSYWDGKDPETGDMHMKKVHFARKRYELRMNPACLAGFAFCDLYNVSKDKKYLECAIRLAEAYVRFQGDDGTWYLGMNLKSGKPLAKNRLTPTLPILFLDYLIREYDMVQFKGCRDSAVAWLFANTMKTYNWQCQFEDSAIPKPYEDASRQEVCEFAVYLLDHVNENPAYLAHAEELMRFAEDQFVEWMKGKPGRIGPGFNEKYTFQYFTARSGYSACVVYLKLYKATGKDIFLAKAVALADGFVSGQEFMRTKAGSWLFMTRNGHYISLQREWVNNNTWGAMAVSEVGKMLEAISKGDKEYYPARKFY